MVGLAGWGEQARCWTAYERFTHPPTHPPTHTQYTTMQDRRYFFHCTRGHVLVLGRRSYEVKLVFNPPTYPPISHPCPTHPSKQELGHALPDRHTVVVSRTLQYVPPSSLSLSLCPSTHPPTHPPTHIQEPSRRASRALFGGSSSPRPRHQREEEGGGETRRDDHLDRR